MITYYINKKRSKMIDEKIKYFTANLKCKSCGSNLVCSTDVTYISTICEICDVDITYYIDAELNIKLLLTNKTFKDHDFFIEHDYNHCIRIYDNFNNCHDFDYRDLNTQEIIAYYKRFLKLQNIL